MPEIQYAQLRDAMLAWQEASVSLTAMTFVPTTDFAAWDKMQAELSKRRVLFAEAQAKLTALLQNLAQ